jgi:hypothetical protein
MSPRQVSVFETNIRVLGGLLSAHLFAVDASLGLMRGYVPPTTLGGRALRERAKRAAKARAAGAGEAGKGGRTGAYEGELLMLAADLGERRMPRRRHRGYLFVVKAHHILTRRVISTGERRICAPAFEAAAASRFPLRSRDGTHPIS